METFYYGTDRLSAGLALDICRGSIKGVISREASERIMRNRKIVEDIVRQEKIVYGINTGFGPLCTTVISEDHTRELQYNLLTSHSVGVGEFVPAEISKLMMILKVHSLSLGYSGVSMIILQRILWHIDHDIIPCVPSQGSVGASGDLAPLAHLFLPLIGKGEVMIEGKTTPSAAVLERYKLKPLELGPKEGLALINGTQFITANAILFLDRFQNCLDNADIIAAMQLEAILGSVKAFDMEYNHLRPYKGSVYVAERMRILLENSEINASHKDCSRIQDPYSLRCIPQVHGAARNAWLHLKEMLEIEINSVTDNPIVFDEDKAISGGNFHGQPIALPIDYAAIAAAEIGNMSDRRIYLALDEKIPGLPKLLMRETGLNSGFMITQYTTAALVSENKSLCFPASADSIPTSMGQEDHVSMGSVSARKALHIISNLEKILAIELFCAAQAFDYRKPLKSGKAIDACHDHIRKSITFVDHDRVLADDINKAIEMVKNKELVKIVNDIALKENINIQNERHELFGIY
ncbi:MAG: histidine ammonia-lyase [Bacteroidales bacterium]|nr:histidine ammonia-lyase [Bacteroidales bacterium]